MKHPAVTLAILCAMAALAVTIGKAQPAIASSDKAGQARNAMHASSPDKAAVRAWDVLLLTTRLPKQE